MKHAAVFCLALLLASCTGSAAGPENSSAGASAPVAYSPSPSAPPRPSGPGQARLEGTYAIVYRLVHSNVSGSTQVERRTWIFTPSCRKGACSARLDSSIPGSKTGDWHARAIFVKGRYRWSRSIQAFTCTIGSTTNPVRANLTYVIKPAAMKLIDGLWIVTRFSGEIDSEGVSSCGFLGTPQERQIVKGTLS